MLLQIVATLQFFNVFVEKNHVSAVQTMLFEGRLYTCFIKFIFLAFI